MADSGTEMDLAQAHLPSLDRPSCSVGPGPPQRLVSPANSFQQNGSGPEGKGGGEIAAPLQPQGAEDTSPKAGLEEACLNGTATAGQRESGSVINTGGENEAPQRALSNSEEETGSPKDPNRSSKEGASLYSEAPGPDDVPCDSCIGSPRKAFKSCLTCLASYCREHLRPHLEKARFQTHRLVEPMQDVEARTCEGHGRPLELYCHTDGCCLCQGCVGEEHRGHNVVPLEEARKEIAKELQQRQGEVTKAGSVVMEAIVKIQNNIFSMKGAVSQVCAVIDQQFSELQEATEGAKREVKETLEREEKQALRQAEGVRAHLEQRSAELRRRQMQVEKLARIASNVDFLQEHAEWRRAIRGDSPLPGVHIGLTDRLSSFGLAVTESTQELRLQLLSTYRDKLLTCQTEKSAVKTSISDDIVMKNDTALPEPRVREDFLKYASTLTLDRATAHRYLRLTEDGRKATNTTPWQHGYPDGPERFQHWRQVLAAESFCLGRHYFEVEVCGEGAHVGLTYRSIERKGQTAGGCITANGFSWCLRRNSRGFSAWHADAETELAAAGALRVGVYLDYDAGLLAFYAVGDAMTLLHSYRAEFLEPLCPAFWLSKKENAALMVAPGDAPPRRSSTSSSTPPTTPTLSPSVLK